MAEDFVLLSTGDKTATETYTDGLGNEVHKQQMVLKKSDGSEADLATQTTLAAILAKLTADPATQTTLAAILAKLPTGAATDATLDELKALIGEVQANPTANTLLDRVKALLTGIVLAAGDNNIGNVDVASSALPEGAATADNQDIANTHLADLVTAAESTDPVVVDLGQDQYETVAASQTDQMCGSTGAIGDYLAGLLIVPASLSPGAVSIEDGSTNITVFAGGLNSVLTLHPFFVTLGIASVSGGWEITTGANVSVIAVGKFT